MYKYPYIPREYYPAVMFACSLIRENGYFNKAIATASDYYGVDYDEVEKHVRKRQAAGQRGKTRKYKYYAAIGYDTGIYGRRDDIDCPSWSDTLTERLNKLYKKVVKATNQKNAKENIEAHFSKDPRDELDPYYSEWFEIIDIKEFGTKKEADEHLWDKSEVTKILKQKEIRFSKENTK